MFTSILFILGSVAYDIRVSPITSTLSMSCNGSGIRSPCTYLEISGHKLIHKQSLDIEVSFVGQTSLLLIIIIIINHSLVKIHQDRRIIIGKRVSDTDPM